MRFGLFRATLVSCLVVLATIAPGCSGPTYIVQQYEGPVRDSETIAVVRINGKDSVLLDSLDGEPIAVRVAEDSRLHVEVLPGQHTVGVLDARAMSGAPSLVPFQAEAGKVYRPVFQPEARIYEVDRDSDAPLRDVTLVQKQAPPVPDVPRAPEPPPAPAEPQAPDAADPAADAGEAPPAPVQPQAPDAGGSDASSDGAAPQ